MTYKPSQKRGAKGTDLGGEFIGVKSVARALIKMMSGHEAAQHDADVKARTPKGGPAIGRLMAGASPAYKRMASHDRAKASRLHDQIRTLDEQHAAPQFSGGRMSNPEERRQNRLQADRLRSELAPIQHRVDTADAIAADHRETHGAAPTPEASLLEAARAHVAAMQRGGAPDVAPSRPEPLSTDPAARAAEIDNRVRAAYAQLAAKPGDWVGLADLRNALGKDANRHEVDASLKRLEQEPGANIVPESNQKTLTQADRDAAVVIGDQAKHAIMISDASPRPVPATDIKTGAGGGISREEAGRRMFGDAGYEAKAAAAKPTAAAKMTRARPAVHGGGAGSPEYKAANVSTAIQDLDRELAAARTQGWPADVIAKMERSQAGQHAELADLRSRFATPDVAAPKQTAAAKVAKAKATPRKLTTKDLEYSTPEQVQQAFEEGRVSPTLAARRMRRWAEEMRQWAAHGRMGSTMGHGVVGGNEPSSPELVANLQHRVDLAAKYDRMANDIQPRATKPSATISAPETTTTARAAVADFTGDYATRRTSLATHAGIEPVSTTPLEGGVSSKAEVLTYADGGRIVRKDYGELGSHAHIYADSEELGAQVLNAVGVPTPAVTRVDDHTILMEHVDGRQGGASGALRAPASVTSSDAGRLLGLADAVMGHRDRNGGGWMRSHDAIVPIDNGAAFDHGEQAAHGNPFASYLMTSHAWKRDVALPVSADELAAIRTRLEALRPEFDRLGHPRQHKEMLGRLDAIEQHANFAAAPTAPKPTAAAKMTRAKASVDHASIAEQVKAARTGDEVRTLLAGQKLTVGDLKTIAGHVGGPSASPKGTKQQIIDHIAAGSGGLKDRPAGLFAGDWHTGTPSPLSAPSAPAPPDAAELERRRQILAAPLAQSRAMRPEDGAGVFSANPEIQRQAAAALNAAGAARAAKVGHSPTTAILFGENPAAPSAPRPTAATKMTRASATWAPSTMTTVGADPADVAERIDRAPNESGVLAHMEGMTVADLRKVARELSMPLPKPPDGGRWTPNTLRQYIATVHLRDRHRWTLR